MKLSVTELNPDMFVATEPSEAQFYSVKTKVREKSLA